MRTRTAPWRTTLLATAMMLTALPVLPAAADNPTTDVTSTGQDLTVTIDAPDDDTRVLLDGSATIVSGGVAVQSLDDVTSALDALYVVDMSGSTYRTGFDCDGSGAVNSGDDFNGVDGNGEILDCEIAGVIALNNSLQSRANTTAAVMGFSNFAAMADVDPAADIQSSVAASAPGTSPTHIETVVRSMRRESRQIREFTRVLVGDSTTNFGDVLATAAEHFAARPAATRVMYFLTDGTPYGTGGPHATTDFRTGPGAALVQALADLGVRVEGFAVTDASTKCATTGNSVATALHEISAATGGSCTYVQDPSVLAAQIAQPVTTTAIEITVNGTTVAPVTFTPGGDGTWSADVASALEPGTNLVEVTAVASDGTRVTSDIALFGDSLPTADAGSDVVVPEGTPAALTGSASDADAGPFTVQWAPPGIVQDLGSPTSPLDTTDDFDGELTMTVTDATGNEATDTTRVTVQNVAPTLVVPNPSPVTAGVPFDLEISGNDPGIADLHSVTITTADGTLTPTVDQSPGVYMATQELTLSSVGEHTITVHVSDGDGGEATQQFTIDAAQAPDVDAGGPYTVPEGASILLDGTATNPSGNGVSAEWSANEPTVGTLSDTTSFSPTYAGRQDGTDTVTLTATSDEGGVGSSTAEVTVTNVAPIVTSVDPVPTRILPGQTLSSAVHWSDPGVDDRISRHFVAGNGGSSETSFVPNAWGRLPFDWTYPSPGEFAWEVWVCDDAGDCSNRGTGQVIVNTPPTIDLPPSIALDEGSSVELPATIADADGQMLDIQWSAPSANLMNADSERPLYYGANDLTETVEVTVSDGIDTVTDTIEVTTRNVRPSFLGAPRVEQLVGLDVTVTFDFTDPGLEDTHEAAVLWPDSSVSRPDLALGQRTVTATHTFPGPGTYRVFLQVQDHGGGQSQNIDVVVQAPPTADAGPDLTIDEGSTGVLTGAGSDPDGQPVTFEWTPSGYTNISSLDSRTVAGPSVTGFNDGIGTYSLRTHDGTTWSETDTMTVTVVNVAPTITSLTAEYLGGTSVGVNFAIDDPGVLDDMHSVWDMGDGTGQIVSSSLRGGAFAYDYDEPGTYTITMTSDDGDGGTDTEQVTVVVNSPPTVDAPAVVEVDEGSTALIAATADDPNGDTLTFRWSPNGYTNRSFLDDGAALQPTVRGYDDSTSTYTLIANDGVQDSEPASTDVVVRNVAPTIGSVSTPSAPTSVAVSIGLSAIYDDPGVLDTHTWSIDWGDGTASAGPAADGALTASHAYALSGIYTATVEVCDDDGGCDSLASEMIVVYDAGDGKVSANVHYDSQPGDWDEFPNASGEAKLGLSAEYKESDGVEYVKGKVKFKLDDKDFAGDDCDDEHDDDDESEPDPACHGQRPRLDLHSDTLDWMVVNGSTAIIRGTGHLHKRGAEAKVDDTYAFLVSVTDGEPDTARIRIWDSRSEVLLYDNGPDGDAVTKGQVKIKPPKD